MSKKLSFSLVSLVVCLAGEAVAQAAVPVNVQSLTSNQIASLQEFKLQPRFNLWGYSGSSTLTEGQFLAPLYGDQSRALYVMAEGNYVKNDSTWLGGAGLGYRQVVGDRIYGGYVTGDVISTELRSKFVIANPGLELLGPVWDFNINGYIPVTNKRKVGKEGWAGDDFGIYKYTRATGHDYYDHRLQQYEEAGRGLDFEVARVIPHVEDAKLHLGAYHFDTPEMGSVNGVESRLSYELNKYTSLEVENDYDNVSHNKVLFGIRFTLGGYSKEEKQQFGVATRLLDPIDHDNIILQSSSLIPIVTSPGTDLGERKEHDNVWYFKAGSNSSSTSPQADNSTADAQSGSGTAENPFIGFTPANYAAINPNEGEINKYPLMFFAPGTYSLSNFSSRDITNRFALPNGWGMYGRNADYTRPNDDDYPAKFTGGIDLNYTLGYGAAVTTLDSVSITNNVGDHSIYISQNAALYAVYANDVSLRNASIVNSTVGDFNRPCVYGIYAYHSTVNFDGGSSKALASSADVTGWSAGVQASGSSVVNFNRGTNAVTGTGRRGDSTIDGGEESTGIMAISSTINFNNGNNIISGTAADSITGGESHGYGIDALYSGVNFNDGTNTVIGSTIGTAPHSMGDGIRAFGFLFPPYGSEPPPAVNFKGGNNTVTGKSTATDVAAYGIRTDNNAKVNLNGGSGRISGSTAPYNDELVVKHISGDYKFLKISDWAPNITESTVRATGTRSLSTN